MKHFLILFAFLCATNLMFASSGIDLLGDPATTKLVNISPTNALLEAEPDILILVFRDGSGNITGITYGDDGRDCITYLEYIGSSVYPSSGWTDCP
jgi:hypothetical protein